MNPGTEIQPPPRWKKWLVPTLSVLAILFVGIALPLALMNLRGKSAWEKTQAELRARGEKLTLVELAPSLPPPNSNFFADSMWLELTDLVPTTDADDVTTHEPRLPAGKRQLDILDAPVPVSAAAGSIAKSVLSAPWHADFAAGATLDDGKMDAIVRIFDNAKKEEDRQALARLILELSAGTAPLRGRIEELLRERPDAVFPVDYSKYRLSGMPASYVRQLGRIYDQLTMAYLALGDRVAARNAIRTQLRLSETLRREPSVSSFVVQATLTNRATEKIAVGIKRHLWTSEDLQIFERNLKRANLVEALVLSLRGSRAEFNDAASIAKTARTSEGRWNKMLALIVPYPGAGKNVFGKTAAATYRFSAANDQIFFNRHIQKIVDTLASTSPLRPADFPSVGQSPDRLFLVTHFFSAMNISMTSEMIPFAFRRQDAVRQTRIACALEQYRLMHHAYPKALTALPPTFSKLDSILGDSPMHYRLEKNDSFVLWSEGWNEIDDGGVAPRRAMGSYLLHDWVWDEPPRP
jgi:hypothetical protein